MASQPPAPQRGRRLFRPTAGMESSAGCLNGHDQRDPRLPTHTQGRRLTKHRDPERVKYSSRGLSIWAEVAEGPSGGRQAGERPPVSDQPNRRTFSISEPSRRRRCDHPRTKVNTIKNLTFHTRALACEVRQEAPPDPQFLCTKQVQFKQSVRDFDLQIKTRSKRRTIQHRETYLSLIFVFDGLVHDHFIKLSGRRNSSIIVVSN